MSLVDSLSLVKAACLVSWREKGAAKARFPRDTERGQICGGKGLVPGGCKNGKTLGLCHRVAKTPEKAGGTDGLPLPGVGVRAGL